MRVVRDLLTHHGCRSADVKGASIRFKRVRPLLLLRESKAVKLYEDMLRLGVQQVKHE